MFQGLVRSLQKQSKWAGALLAVGAGVGVAACGASIQALYEGDVRFEHCMALDGQPDVKSHIRRACWREWISFYTYGQTRDRVRHAQKRIRQLSGVSEFLTGPRRSSIIGSRADASPQWPRLSSARILTTLGLREEYRVPTPSKRSRTCFVCSGRGRSLINPSTS